MIKETIIKLFTETSDNDIPSETLEEEIINTSISLFKCPIDYQEFNYSLEPQLIEDLELFNVKQDSNSYPIFEYIYKPSTSIGKKIIKNFNKYSTNTEFLKQNQRFIEQFKDDQLEIGETEKFVEIWNMLKNDNGFTSKLCYIDNEYFDFLNYNEIFLNCVLILQSLNPLMSFSIPFILVIAPFIIIKSQGHEISFSTYQTIFYGVFKRYFIGNSNAPLTGHSETISLVISIFMYLFNLYSNICLCKKLYKNIEKLKSYLKTFGEYLTKTYDLLLKIETVSSIYPHFHGFLNDLRDNKLLIKEMMESCNETYVLSLGKLMKFVYTIYRKPEYEKTIQYVIGFNAYIDSLSGLLKNINSGSLNRIEYTKTKQILFEDIYYPPLIDTDKITNKFKMGENNRLMIISGVNASGKTTIIKSIIINIILSQTIGFGTFTSGILLPHEGIYSYINIVDTSDRYSLFQTECIKCKETIDKIQKNSNDNQFYIFDELLNGTNPDEAIMCSYGFLRYILQYTNCKILITTHFVKLIEKLYTYQKSIGDRKILIKQMNSFYKDEILNHSYKLKTGINRIKGGLDVIEKMKFPQDMINIIKEENK